MSRKILHVALGAAVMHLIVALLSFMTRAPRWDAVLHLVFAGLYLTAGARFGALAVAAPLWAARAAWALLVLDAGQLAWSAVAWKDLRHWIAVHALAWTPLLSFGLVRLVRQLSAAAADTAPPPPPAAAAGARTAWGRIPPRLRGLLLLGLGLALLKGAALFFARRGGYLSNLRPDESDPLGILFAPGVLVALLGFVEFVLGRPFGQWEGAWDEMPEWGQRLVVYGILFGSPIALYLFFR